ncbi:PQQ-dependent sugar dehydrogenase [Virgisporangium ochraceum]
MARKWRGVPVAVALSVALVVVAALALRDRSEPAPPPAADHGHGNRSGAGVLITTAPALALPETAVTTVAAGLEAVRAIAFRPDGTALVAEGRTGRIVAVRPGGQPSVFATVPGIEALRSITVHTDGTVYALVTSTVDNRVVGVRANGSVEPVLTGIPRGPVRNGGAIAAGPDGMLYVATGDAGDERNAPDPTSLAGKVLRITPGGTVAPDNPQADSMVYSRGHRDPQGLAWYGQTDLFLAEAGSTPDGAPDRHDELNLIQANGDYGWPATTAFGSNRRYVNPVAAWQPGEAGFGGLAVKGGRVYLAGTKLYRIWLEGTEPQTLLDGKLPRLHAIATAPDDAVWVATDDSVLRVGGEALP